MKRMKAIVLFLALGVAGVVYAASGNNAQANTLVIEAEGCCAEGASCCTGGSCCASHKK